MRHHSDEAYVLGTHQLGEADLIVTLLAEQAGRVRGVARAARRSRRRFGGALEPLTRVRAGWSEREGRDLARIDSLEPLRSYAGMQAEPGRQAACAVIAEIAGGTEREGQGDPRLFRLLGAVFDAVEQGLHPVTAVRYFELWTLKLHGVLPELGYCARCSSAIAGSGRRWACAEHGLLCAGCRGRTETRTRPVGSGERAFVAAALANPPAGLDRFVESTRTGAGLELLLRGSLQAFLERGLRTYRHLERAVGATQREGRR